MFEFNNKNLGKSYSSKKNVIDLKTQSESSGIEKTSLKIFFKAWGHVGILGISPVSKMNMKINLNYQKTKFIIILMKFDIRNLFFSLQYHIILLFLNIFNFFF